MLCWTHNSRSKKWSWMWKNPGHTDCDIRISSFTEEWGGHSRTTSLDFKRADFSLFCDLLVRISEQLLVFQTTTSSKTNNLYLCVEGQARTAEGHHEWTENFSAISNTRSHLQITKEGIQDKWRHCLSRQGGARNLRARLEVELAKDAKSSKTSFSVSIWTAKERAR